MNEALISSTLARLAKDGDSFSSTEYIVRCEHGTMMRIGPDRDGLDMIRCLFTEPTTPVNAGRTLADFDMTSNFARRVALAILQAADDADATAAAERDAESE